MLKEIAMALGFLAPITALGQDKDYVVEQGKPFHMPFHTAENQGMALSIIEKAQELVQEQENKLATEQKRAPSKVQFTPEEAMWYAEVFLNADGYNGVTKGEVLEAIANNPAFKDLKPKRSDSASMELQTSRFAYENSDSQNKLNELLETKAKEAGAENSPLYQEMMKAKIAKTYGAKKVKTNEGEAKLITSEMVNKFEKDPSIYVLTRQKAKAPEAEKDYTVDFTLKFESPTDLAYAKRLVDVTAAYKKATKQPDVPKTEEDKIYMLSQMADEKNNVSGKELEQRINSMNEAILELPKKDQIDWGEAAVGSETEVKAYIKVTMSAEDRKRMKETADKYSLTQGQVLVWLRNHYTPGAVKGEGTMNSEQVTKAIKTLDEQYKEK